MPSLDIKKLRSIQKEYKDKMWTNLTISIHNAQFKIEYFYSLFLCLKILKSILTKRKKSIILDLTKVIL